MFLWLSKVPLAIRKTPVYLLTYLLTPLAILASFGSSVFFWLSKGPLAIRVFLLAIRGSLWLSKVPLALQGSFGYPRFLWFFRGFLWLSKVPLDLQGLFGYPWFLRLAEVPLAIRGFLWLSKAPLAILGSFGYLTWVKLSTYIPTSLELAGCIGDKVPRLNHSYLCLDWTVKEKPWYMRTLYCYFNVIPMCVYLTLCLLYACVRLTHCVYDMHVCA